MLLARWKGFQEFRINLPCLTVHNSSWLIWCAVCSETHWQQACYMQFLQQLLSILSSWLKSCAIPLAFTPFPLQQCYPFTNTDLCIQVTPTSMALGAQLFRSTCCCLYTVKIVKSNFICLWSAPRPQFRVLKAFARAPGQIATHCSASLPNVNWRWRIQNFVWINEEHEVIFKYRNGRFGKQSLWYPSMSLSW